MFFTNEASYQSAFHRTGVPDTLLRRALGWGADALEGGLGSAIAVAVYLITCFFFQKLAPDFHLPPLAWSWNLTGGLSFGFLLTFGFAYAPVVFLAYLIPLLADGSITLWLWPVIGFAVSNTIAVGLACYAVRRLRTASELDLEDSTTFITILAVIPFMALAMGLLSTMNWWFAGVLPPDTFFVPLLTKTLGNGIGLLLAGPFVLINGIPLFRAFRDRSNPFASVDTCDLVQGAALLHVTAASVVAMSLFSMDGVEGHLMFFGAYFLFFVPFVSMTFKFGLRGLTSSFLVVGVARTVLLFVEGRELEGSFIETTLLAAVISTLIVASLVTERARILNTARRPAVAMVGREEQGRDFNEVSESKKLSGAESGNALKEDEYDPSSERLDEARRLPGAGEQSTDSNPAPGGLEERGRSLDAEQTDGILNGELSLSSLPPRDNGIAQAEQLPKGVQTEPASMPQLPAGGDFSTLPELDRQRRPIEGTVQPSEHVLTDRDANLMWIRKDNGRGLDWSGAKDYARKLDAGGYRDWWLPTIEELEKLYDPTNDGEFKVKRPIDLTHRFVWSCSMAGSHSTWFFDFGNGRRKLTKISDPKPRVLCVRDLSEGV